MLNNKPIRPRLSVKLSEKTKEKLEETIPAGNSRAEMFQSLIKQITIIFTELPTPERIRVMHRVLTGDVRLYLIEEEGSNNGNAFEVVGPGTEYERARMADALNGIEDIETDEEEV